MSEAIRTFKRNYSKRVVRSNGIRVGMAVQAFEESYKKQLRHDRPGSTPAPTPRKVVLEAVRSSQAIAAFRRRYNKD